MKPDGFIDLLIQLAPTLDILWRKSAADSSEVNSDQFGRYFPVRWTIPNSDNCAV